jgi:hypothetical protein
MIRFNIRIWSLLISWLEVFTEEDWGVGCGQTIDSNVSLSHIALSLGAGVLYAGTEQGAIRAYQYPLTGMLLLHPLDTTRIKVYI